MAKVISVFGSSAPVADSDAYRTAQELGRLLAQAGYTVATGGYMGTMEAVSRGAAEAGGHVLGITCDQIQQFRPILPNRWIGEEIRYGTLRQRLLHLIDHNAGMVTLPGGIGTLSEMSLAWSFLQTGEIEKRPFILLGDMWQQTIDAFQTSDYVRPEHLALLQFAQTPAAALQLIEAYA